MEFQHALILVAVGIIAGFLNVMAGGGSMLSVPVMIFLGIPGPIANGTNRIAILAQNITAVITFFKKGFADFKLSLSLSLCAIPGAIAGALLGVQLEGIWFNRILAIIMVMVLLLLIFERKNPNPDMFISPSRKRVLLGHVLMAGVGCFGGFIQVGVGFVIMPVLQRVLGLDLVKVNMHKVFIIGSYTIVALIIYAWQVEILWLLGFCLAIGNSIGGWLATHVQIARGERIIRIILYSILILFVIKLLFFSH